MGILGMTEHTLHLARQVVDTADVSELVSALGSLQRNIFARIAEPSVDAEACLASSSSTSSQRVVVITGSFSALISKAYSSAIIYDFLSTQFIQAAGESNGELQELPHLKLAVAADIFAQLMAGRSMIIDARDLLSLDESDIERIDYLFLSGACKDPSDSHPVQHGDPGGVRGYRHPMSILTLIWTLDRALAPKCGQGRTMKGGV